MASSGRPEPFVGRDRHFATLPHFLHIHQRVLDHRLLDEIDLKLVQTREVPQSLIDIPGAVGIEPNFAFRSDGLAERANHFEFRLDIQTDLQIKNLKALANAVPRLLGHMLGSYPANNSRNNWPAREPCRRRAGRAADRRPFHKYPKAPCRSRDT